MEEFKKDPIKIKGDAILSTIQTMESFGSIGEEVLKDFGISHIEKDKSYPFEIRNKLHKVLLDRFGEIALTSFGFKNGESFQQKVIQTTNKIYHRNLTKTESKNRKDNTEALNKVFNSFIKGIDYMAKRSSQGAEANLGAIIKSHGDGWYECHVTTATVPFQAPFITGTIMFHLTRLFGKHWNWKLDFDKEKISTGHGFSTFVYTIGFKREISNATCSEIINNKKMELRDELIKSVLEDSNKQKMQLQNVFKQLGKYTPIQIQSSLMKGDYDTKITTLRRKITIFFSDIKNFTSTSEGLQPEDLTKYLNEYFSEMTAIALDCGATIDKYIGDAMMVFFGDPKTLGERNDARACVDMALRMQNRMFELQEKWKNCGFANPFQVRMGINTGYCNVGNFGSEQRLTYTIIGGEVNVAQRLEAASDENGILMSYETYAHVKDMVEVEERKAIKMKGISREIKLFSVIMKTKDVNIKKPLSEKKLNKEELSKIGILEKEVAKIRSDMHIINKNIEMLLKRS